MKRVIALVVAVAFAGSCFAGSCCSGKKNCQGDKDTSTTQTTKPAPRS